jgi:hypothetical protein
VFGRDAGEIAGGRMAATTAACSIEVRFARGSVAGQEFFEGIIAANVIASQGSFELGVEERDYIGHLILRQRESRHAFVGAAIANHGRQQFTVNVVAENGGADQIGRAGSGSVVAMAESARGLEFECAAFDGIGIGRVGGPEGPSRQRKNKERSHESFEYSIVRDASDVGEGWELEGIRLFRETGMICGGP